MKTERAQKIFNVFDSIKGLSWYVAYRKNVLKMKLRSGRDYAYSELFREHNMDVIFIHIPKSAGMSVVDALYNMESSNHASVMDYITENRERYEKTFSFAIVRNPYTRLYSAYQYLKSGGMGLEDQVWFELYIAPFRSFEKFVVDGGLEIAITNKADHFKLQCQFVCDAAGELRCDYIGYFEDLEAVELTLSSRLQKKVSFVKKNVTNKFEIDPTLIYSPQMIEKVNYLYDKDFWLFGYEKL